MNIDLSRVRRTPYDHQIIGVRRLVEHEYFFLTDEMGAGKTKQTIDAAQVLFEMGKITNVVVICPASVRTVWFDPEYGELAKHLWETIPAEVEEFHQRVRTWRNNTPRTKQTPILRWLITNYDYIRNGKHCREVISRCSSGTLLVLDETAAIKNWKALQTTATFTIRQRCGRVIMLNGTPIANTPADLFAQGMMMSPTILGLKTFYAFRSKYAVLGGYKEKQIVGWRNVDDLTKRFAPYVLRRLKKDCLDLPEKMEPVTLSVPLTESSWKVYKEMRDEMIAWLSSTNVAVTAQAAVKAMRLAQICAGFVGGVQEEQAAQPVLFDEERPDWLMEDDILDESDLGVDLMRRPEVVSGKTLPPRELGTEKLDYFIDWVTRGLEEDPTFKVIVWCRFKPQLYKAQSRLIELFGKHVAIAAIHGSQTKADRAAALRLVHPDTADPKQPVFLLGTKGTGSLGLNMAAAHRVFGLSDDYSLYKRKQSDDRVHRPGQVHAVSYWDLVATGPRGQKTIDHSIIKAQREKDNVATWTTAAWVRALTEE